MKGEESAHMSRFGPRFLEDGKIRFQIWAPDVNSLGIEIDGETVLPMQRDGDGWYALDSGCAAGTRYAFILPDGTRVPDPAARAQLQDAEGDSLVVDGRSYRWNNPNWRGKPWSETVLYEVHVGLAGGFDGLRARLDWIASLGVTALELMPIADFYGAHNWGYDGVLPYAPDAAYGTPDALRALVDAAHDLGLSVFLDVVYNHFGPRGNFLGLYAKAFFRDDVDTPWGIAIDFRRPEVREFFTANAIYWLTEYRFDGLRLDAVHTIEGAGWLEALPAQVRAAVGGERYVHLVLENDDNDAHLLEQGFDAQWNDDAHHALHVLLTGEAFGYYADHADAPAKRLARCLAQGFDYQGEFSAYRDSPRGSSSAHLPASSFVWFLQNHDQIGNRALGERLPVLARPTALRAAMALLLLAPYVPLLFMGDEHGSTTPFLYFTGYNGELARAVRDGRRREFARFPGFATADMQATIPDPNDVATFLACRTDAPGAPHDAQALEWLGWMRGLLLLRRSCLAGRLAGTSSLGAWALGDSAVAARWRLGDGQVLALFTNLGTVDTPLDGVRVDSGRTLLYESMPGAACRVTEGTLPAATTVARFEDDI